MNEATQKPDLPERWRVSAEMIGREKMPVVQIDNFVAEPDRLVADARTADFQAIAPYYPGVRAAVRAPYFADISQGLTLILAGIFGYQRGFKLEECVYSLVTRPADELAPMQSMPHFDGVNDRKLALLHYMCETNAGGTAFYRHRSTGYEVVTDARFPGYKKALEADVARVGMPKKDYPRGSSDLFEQTARYAAAYNRAIIYPGIVLHSIDIPEDFPFNADAESGRLTVNSFLTPL